MSDTIKWDDMVAEISRYVSLELHRPYADEGWSWAIYLGGAEVTSPPRKGLKRTRAMAQAECEEWYRRLVRGRLSAEDER